MKRTRTEEIIIIRFRITSLEDNGMDWQKAGIDPDSAKQATIDDFITGGVNPEGKSSIIFMLEESRQYNWNQFHRFFSKTKADNLPVLLVYDFKFQKRTAQKLSRSYPHVLLFALGNTKDSLPDKLEQLEKFHHTKNSGENSGDGNKNADENTQSYFMLAHEVKTPLSAVIGYTEELIEDESIDDYTAAQLKKIYTNSYQLLHVISNYLEKPSHYFGEMATQKSKVKLRKMISDIVDWQHRSNGIHDVTYNLSIAPGFDEEILLREGDVRQILINLIHNAYQHTACGEIAVRVKRVHKSGIQHLHNSEDYVAVDNLSQEDPSPTLLLQIEDDGNGIEKALIPKIFEYGYSSQKNSHGSEFEKGLGLVVVQQIVEKLGGMLSVSSKPVEGTQFNIVVPYAYEQLNERPKSSIREKASSSSKNKRQLKQLNHELGLLNEEVRKQLTKAIEGLDLNQIILACDHNTSSNTPMLEQVYKAALFKDFRHLVDIQSLLLLEEEGDDISADKDESIQHEELNNAGNLRLLKTDEAVESTTDEDNTFTNGRQIENGEKLDYFNALGAQVTGRFN
mgnify:CR=1 FL=1